MSKQDWETKCPIRIDGIHCTCWYDGESCCGCGEGALTEMEKASMESTTRGEHPIWG